MCNNDLPICLRISTAGAVSRDESFVVKNRKDKALNRKVKRHPLHLDGSKLGESRW